MITKLNIPMARDFAKNTGDKVKDFFTQDIEDTINNAYKNGCRWAYFEHFAEARIPELEELVIPYGYKVIKLASWNKFDTQLAVAPAEDF